MVISKQGIAATSQVLASQAAAQILSKGGSAVDAAIAANAVLGLVEPMMCGIGGDMFAMHWDAKTGKLTGLNASGPAPRALTPAYLAAKGFKTMPVLGIDTVTVPGAVAGWWAMHQRFGKLPWKDLFQAAIAYADDGFPLSEAIVEAWGHSRSAKPLQEDAETKKLFLPVPAEGQVFRNPELARAYRLIAEHGPDALYRGEIASAILKTSRELGGTMTAGDLSSFSPEFVEPIFTDYRGWRIYELPPQRAGHGRTRNAEHHGDVSGGAVRSFQPRRSAQENRSDEAGLRGPAPLRCRSPHL